MEIPLTKGQVALVDEIDLLLVKPYRWCATWNEHTQSYYATTQVGGRKNRETIYMHRLVLGLKRGDRRQGEHVETGQTIDNRRSNLRIATHSENQWNTRIPKTNTSGLKHVSFDKARNKWRVVIGVHRHYKTVGRYDTRAEAEVAAGTARGSYHGQFARAE